MTKKVVPYVEPAANAEVSTEALIVGESVDSLAALLVSNASATWHANPAAYPATEFMDYVQDIARRSTSIRHAINKMRNIPHR